MSYISSLDDTMRGDVEAAGYRLIRASFHMAIELGDLAGAGWPEGIEVTTTTRSGTRRPSTPPTRSRSATTGSTSTAHRGVARLPRRTPAFDPSFWFVARESGEIAGISLCRVHWSGDPEHGYVGALGVRRPWRKHGLGLALLQHSFARDEAARDDACEPRRRCGEPHGRRRASTSAQA